MGTTILILILTFMISAQFVIAWFVNQLMAVVLRVQFTLIKTDIKLHEIEAEMELIKKIMES